MILFYGGEDDVTKWIAKRMANEISDRLKLSHTEIEDIGFRERGTAVLNKLPKIVSLGKKYPIIFVFDSDRECVVEILKKYCQDGWKDTFATINIAIDEGESWLVADQENFSSFMGIEGMITEMPESEEVVFPYKTSLYIMMEFVPKSRKQDIKDNMSCTNKGKKPPTYNDMWKDYIEHQWNIESASTRSESLKRAMVRIESAVKKYLHEYSDGKEKR